MTRKEQLRAGKVAIMLAPQTLITATLMTIAEPDGHPYLEALGNYLTCVVCGQCFDDGTEAYTIGGYGTAYLHTACV